MQPDTKQRKPSMEVRDLFFSYGKNKVLKGTSFTIEEGKITTIMGAVSYTHLSHIFHSLFM